MNIKSIYQKDYYKSTSKNNIIIILHDDVDDIKDKIKIFDEIYKSAYKFFHNNIIGLISSFHP